MRDSSHEGLARLAVGLVELARLARDLMETASEALLSGDDAYAASVIARAPIILRRHQDLEDKAFGLLAQHPPSATELRALIAAVQISADVDRMGAHAVGVAQVVERSPHLARIPTIEPLLHRAADAAATISTQTIQALIERDLAVAAEAQASGTVMDTVGPDLLVLVLDPTWAHGPETAVRFTQLARHYARYAAHARAVTRQVVFIVTGHLPD